MQTETPMIFTKHGNLPIESLERFAEWDITDDYIKLTCGFKLSGEIVQNDVHVMPLKPLSALMTQGNIGG